MLTDIGFTVIFTVAVSVPSVFDVAVTVAAQLAVIGGIGVLYVTPLAVLVSDPQPVLVQLTPTGSLVVAVTGWGVPSTSVSVPPGVVPTVIWFTEMFTFADLLESVFDPAVTVAVQPDPVIGSGVLYTTLPPTFVCSEPQPDIDHVSLAAPAGSLVVAVRVSVSPSTSALFCALTLTQIGTTVIVAVEALPVSATEAAVIVATQFDIPATDAAGVKAVVEVLPLTVGAAVDIEPHVAGLTLQAIPPPGS
jgi:hypothetical protein